MSKYGEIADRLRFLIRVAGERWGISGVGALLLGLALLAFAAFWLFPAYEHLAALEAAQPLTIPNPVKKAKVALEVTQPVELLRVFTESFPPETLILAITDQLNKAADESGLGVTQADYRLNSDPSGLIRYEVALATHATYPQVRRFAAACITRFPTLSLDGLTMSRASATDPAIDAQFRLSIYVAAN